VTGPKATAAQPALSSVRHNYVARQPIFTADEKVFGYELLFRDGVEDYFRETDADAAAQKTLDTSQQMGLQTLCEGRLAFVNCTREVLLKDYVTLLPSTQTVVEVLESVPADDLVKAAVQRLKQAGYMIALDDFVLDDARTPLVEFADILKVDLQITTPDQRATLVHRFGPWRCRMLIEKVRRERNSTRPGLRALFISRDTSFANPSCCRPKRFRQIGSTTYAYCKPFPSRTWKCARWKN